MIFISYRRADSESVVCRIYSELKKHFPTQDLFLDHDSIPLGKPFLDVNHLTQYFDVFGNRGVYDNG